MASDKPMASAFHNYEVRASAARLAAAGGSKIGFHGTS
jgi:hypothetical protein